MEIKKAAKYSFYISILGAKLNDGLRHMVYLTSENNIFKIDQVIIKAKNIDNIFKNFRVTFEKQKLFIGKSTFDSINQPYEGCFMGLNVGGTNYDLNVTSSNVKYGCSSSFEQCSPSPCVNGECTDIFNDYTCTCPPFYTGKTCNETVDVTCAFNQNLCQNDGKCGDKPESTSRNFSQNGFDKFQCNCKAGYYGVVCENKITCDSEPCGKYGNCTDLTDGISCKCHLGFSGERCDINNTQLCEITTPCKNGGTCFANVTGYFCECSSKFSGKDCMDKLTTKNEGDDSNLVYIIVFSVLGALILIIIIGVLVVKYCRDKSGMEGTYSPNKEEQSAGNVEMSTVKKPKTERLI